MTAPFTYLPGYPSLSNTRPPASTRPGRIKARTRNMDLDPAYDAKVQGHVLSYAPAVDHWRCQSCFEAYESEEVFDLYDGTLTEPCSEAAPDVVPVAKASPEPCRCDIRDLMSTGHAAGCAHRR